MTGLDLAAFLRLLRIDAGLWASFGVIVVLLALMAWTSWCSRRALRNCLVLSVIVHLGLIAFGGQTGWALRAFGPAARGRKDRERIRSIRVSPSRTVAVAGR